MQSGQALTVSITANNASGDPLTLGKKLGGGSFGNVYQLIQAPSEQAQNEIRLTLNEDLSPGRYVAKLITDLVPGIGSIEKLNSGALQQCFKTYKLSERNKMLPALQQEAACATRYSGKKVVVIEGEPVITVTYDEQQPLAYLYYHPAIAMLMPYVAGMSLTEYATHFFTGSFTFNGLLKLFSTIIDEFSTLHALNILHLDPSPNNIMINPETNQVKLVDFGQSTYLINDEEFSRVPRVEMNGSYLYWRKNRTRPLGSEPSEAIVSVEDDTFGLQASLTSLIKLYQLYIRQEKSAPLLIACFDKMRVFLDEPHATLKDSLWFLAKIVTLVGCLDILSSPEGQTKKEISNLKSEIRSAHFYLGKSAGEHVIFSPLKQPLDKFYEPIEKNTPLISQYSLCEEFEKENIDSSNGPSKKQKLTYS